MSTPLELLQKQNAALQQARAADANKLKGAAKAIIELRGENDDLNHSLQQMRDLLFACLHSFGPKVHIQIKDFRNFMRHAEFDGTLELDEHDNFVATLEFFLEGKPKTENENDGE